MKATIVILCLLVLTMAETTSFDDSQASDLIIDQIEQMESAVLDEQYSHQKLFDVQFQQCDEEIALRKSEIEIATSALQNSQSALNKCQNAQVAVVNDIANAQSYVSTIKEILNELTVKRNNDLSAYNNLVGLQLTPALESIQGLYPLILDANNPHVHSEEIVPNGGDLNNEALDEKPIVILPSEFVQITSYMNKVFKNFVAVKKTEEFGSLLTLLIQQEEEGASEENIAHLISLLHQLEEQIQAAIDRANENEAASVEQYNTNVASYSEILGELSNTVDSMQAYLNELQSCVDDETAVSNEASVKQSHNTASLNHAIDMCDALVNEYNNASQARDEELESFLKLKTFIENQSASFGELGANDVDVLAGYNNSFIETQSTKRADFLQTSLLRYKKKNPIKKSDKKSFLQKRMGF